MSDQKLVDKLLTDFTAADNAWKEADEAKNRAYRKRSDVIQAISKAINPQKRIQLPDGTVGQIVCRTSKEDGTESWFFRFGKEADVFKVK